MILGMSIIVFIIFKQFFLEPSNKKNEIKLPDFIKIPNKSTLESIDLNHNNISMVIRLYDRSQQLLIVTFDNGVETSRQYIDINNSN